MANFTVRVVLHDADWNDYELLHACMEAGGFDRTITGSNGVVLQLPDAEYSISAVKTCDEVRELAVRAATFTKKKHAVLVTLSAGRCWVGLERA